ncbi:hypothetical protein DIPPA_04512 [Diplonema papillatum]|nr:hypothetical protein DIPPA_04512 [Diplonema papillatum]
MGARVLAEARATVFSGLALAPDDVGRLLGLYEAHAGAPERGRTALAGDIVAVELLQRGAGGGAEAAVAFARSAASACLPMHPPGVVWQASELSIEALHSRIAVPAFRAGHTQSCEAFCRWAVDCLAERDAGEIPAYPLIAPFATLQGYCCLEHGRPREALDLVQALQRRASAQSARFELPEGAVAVQLLARAMLSRSLPQADGRLLHGCLLRREPGLFLEVALRLVDAGYGHQLLEADAAFAAEAAQKPSSGGDQRTDDAAAAQHTAALAALRCGAGSAAKSPSVVPSLLERTLSALSCVTPSYYKARYSDLPLRVSQASVGRENPDESSPKEDSAAASDATLSPLADLTTMNAGAKGRGSERQGSQVQRARPAPLVSPAELSVCVMAQVAAEFDGVAPKVANAAALMLTRGLRLTAATTTALVEVSERLMNVDDVSTAQKLLDALVCRLLEGTGTSPEEDMSREDQNSPAEKSHPAPGLRRAGRRAVALLFAAEVLLANPSPARAERGTSVVRSMHRMGVTAADIEFCTRRLVAKGMASRVVAVTTGCQTPQDGTLRMMILQACAYHLLHRSVPTDAVDRDSYVCEAPERLCDALRDIAAIARTAKAAARDDQDTSLWWLACLFIASARAAAPGQKSELFELVHEYAQQDRPAAGRAPGGAAATIERVAAAIRALYGDPKGVVLLKNMPPHPDTDLVAASVCGIDYGGDLLLSATLRDRKAFAGLQAAIRLAVGRGNLHTVLRLLRWLIEEHGFASAFIVQVVDAIRNDANSDPAAWAPFQYIVASLRNHAVATRNDSLLNAIDK